MKSVIDKLSGGLAPDQVDYNLPEGFFSNSTNVRFRDDSAEKCKGNQAVFGSLSATAIWANNIGDGTTSYFAYANEAVVYATDGTTHSQISTASYNAPTALGYTGGEFHGFQILNDTVLVPQRWAPALSNKVRDLDNWPASTFCKVIRPYGNFLVAMRITQDAVYNPRLLRWSDAAAFGALPSSWDYTDPTNQAGITELGHSDDYIVDGKTLRDSFIVYKQASTFLMTPIGGLDVFAFRELFTESGMLSEGCVAGFNQNHFVLSDHDVVIHDGSAVQSVADKRIRRAIFNSINPQRFDRCFVIPNRRERQIYVCIPETGNNFPNIAWVWSIPDNSWHKQELGGNISHADEGIVIGADLTIDGMSGTIDGLTGAIDDSTFTPFSRRLVLFSGLLKKALQQDTGETFDGTTMQCSLERSNIGLTRDVGSVKSVKRVFPKVIGTAGDSFKIYVGSRMAIDMPVTYQGPFTFVVGTDYKIDCRASGRYISLRFDTAVTNSWRLSGFDVEFDTTGRR